MIHSLFALLLTLAQFSYAQKEDLNARDPRLNEGQLFTVSWRPADKRITVSLAGKPQAELGPDRIVVFGRAYFSDGKSVNLTVRPSGESFVISEPVPDSQSVEVEVQDKRDAKKKEKFKFNLR